MSVKLLLAKQPSTHKTSLYPRSLLIFHSACPFFSLCSISDQKDPKERMVQVVKWYLSAFHAGRKGSVAKKPYNPILGEIFRCHWVLPGTEDDMVSFSLCCFGAQNAEMQPRALLSHWLKWIVLWLVANQQNYSNFLTNSPSLHFLKDYLMCWKCPFSLNCSITLIMNLFIPRVLVFIFIFLILFFKPMQPSEVFCYFFVWLFFGTSFGFLASGSCQWWCGQCCCGVLHVASL